MFSSSSASSSSASDTPTATDASVLRSARKRCHAARDAYAACVDASGTPPSARGTARGLVVPGSQPIKRAAEAEGLDKIFRAAGAEWREAGCSMCIAMNGDQLQPGQYSVSTSNRNFEGRQGKGARTFLASPQTAAASAVNGVVTDPRTLLR